MASMSATLRRPSRASQAGVAVGADGGEKSSKTRWCARRVRDRRRARASCSWTSVPFVPVTSMPAREARERRRSTPRSRRTRRSRTRAAPPPCLRPRSGAAACAMRPTRGDTGPNSQSSSVDACECAWFIRTPPPSSAHVPRQRESRVVLGRTVPLARGPTRTPARRSPLRRSPPSSRRARASGDPGRRRRP